MTFEAIWHPKAVKALEKLPINIAIRIREKVDTVKEDPKRYSEKLVGMERESNCCFRHLSCLRTSCWNGEANS